MASLVEASADPAESAALMGRRINAKAAQAALLQRATFGHDPEGFAARQAVRLVADCRALLLG